MALSIFAGVTQGVIAVANYAATLTARYLFVLAVMILSAVLAYLITPHDRPLGPRVLKKIAQKTAT
ncbi:hypothetical protein SMC26_18415 [Actinomadura fulvescens]|uniref:hypothetical protein n=1 Tax=Actinomadura fulvescens TaxID=46160 RepID=UPI0031CDBB1B